MTIPQVRFALAELLLPNPRSPRRIAADITRQLRRNEQARRARWRKLGLSAPEKQPPPQSKRTARAAAFASSHG